VEAFFALGRGVYLGDSGLTDSAAKDEFWERQALRGRRVAGRFDWSHRDNATMLMAMDKFAERWKYLIL
jgi:hypothetical protein